MILSIVFIALFALTVTGVVLYPKSEYKLNGVKTVVIGIMAVSCYLFFAAAVSCLLLKYISIGIVCIFLLLVSLAFWMGIYKEKKVQSFFWRAFDAGGMILVMVFACGICFHVFTTGFLIQYRDSAGAEQFLAAMRLLRKDNGLGPISFTAGTEALFIRLFSPFLAEIEYYKAFIVSEIFLRLLEICMFYVVVLTVSDRKVVRYAAPVLSICYFFGYAALSLLSGNYEYWNSGAVLLLFVVYALLVIEKREDMKRFSIPLLAASCIINLCGAYLYASMNTFAVVGALFVIFLKKWKCYKSAKRKYGCLGIMVILAMAAVLIFYQEYFITLHGEAAGRAVTEGIYRCMYGDLLFFLPAFFFVFFYVFFKKNYSCVIAAVSVCMLAGTVTLYVLWYNFLLDTSWYFLSYYNLWLLGWLLAVMALEITADTKQLPVFASYAGLVAVIGTLTLTNYDYHMWYHRVEYNQLDVAKNFFSLYRWNMDGILTDYAEYRMTDQVLEAFNYVIEDSDMEKTAIVTSDEAFMCWNDALTDTASDKYRLDRSEFPDVVQALSDDGVNAVVVIKNEENYRDYKSYYEQCDILFENEGAMVCTFAGEAWSDILALEPDYSAEKQELFAYIRENLSGETVPLMAERTAYMDFIVYHNMTGMELKEFYTWYYNPVENLNNLNEKGVSYIVLLDEDGYYQSTKEYFDRQEVVFENGAGRVLKCSGEKWSTQY